MSKKSRYIHKLGKQQQKELKTKTKFSPKFWKIVSGLLAIFGDAVAALTLLPRISVLPSDPVEPSNPFSASFTIINNNFIPLHEVDAMLGLGQIAMEPKQMDPNFLPTFGSRLVYKTWTNHSLTMDERFTITISDVFSVPSPVQVGGADIAIIVSYKPWLLPIKRENTFRFVTHKQTNGYLYWYSLPLDYKNKICSPT